LFVIDVEVPDQWNGTKPLIRQQYR